MTDISDKEIEKFLAENSTALGFTVNYSYYADTVSVFRALNASMDKPFGLKPNDSEYYQTQLKFFLEPNDKEGGINFDAIKDSFQEFKQTIAPPVAELKIVEEVAPATVESTKKIPLWKQIVASVSGAAAALVVTFTSVDKTVEEANPEPIINNEPTTATKYVKDSNIIKPTFSLEGSQRIEVMHGKNAIIDLLDMLPDAVSAPDLGSRVVAIQAIENKLTALLRNSPAINHDGEGLIPSAKGLIVDFSRKAGLTEVVEAVVGLVKSQPYQQSTNSEVAASAARELAGREQG